ncbi:MAG: TonB C-terminal domain-containing protein [Dechloromonas sp.]|jgi:colicin import membrane protein|nr:TonB C-terminal domain-containing protein [Dechloromonas sp.]
MIPTETEEPGKKPALALTVLMHLVLVVVLFFGVQWKHKAPESVEVELWSSRPVPATAPPTPRQEPKPQPKPEPKPEPRPEPKPEVKPPPKPDIALKEERKQPKPEPKPEPKADPFREMLEREKREQQQRTLTAQAQRETDMKAAAEAEQRAAASRRGLADWVGRITGKIRGNMVLPQSIQGNPQAVFKLTLLPSGEVLQPVRLVKSSGNAALDAAIERAILKSSPLPKPDDPAVFQRELEIRYKPFEE